MRRRLKKSMLSMKEVREKKKREKGTYDFYNVERSDLFNM